MNMREDISIEQILKSIRQVILGKQNNLYMAEDHLDDSNQDQEDVYELTQVAPDPCKNFHSDLPNKPEEVLKTEQEKLSQNNTSKNSTSQHYASKSLESLVAEMIGPYLQKWFDENLVEIKNLTAQTLDTYLNKWLQENLPQMIKGIVEEKIRKLAEHDAKKVNNN